MKYKTVRQDSILGSFAFLIALAIFLWAASIAKSTVYIIITGCAFLAGLLVFIYTITYNVKRKYFKKHGKCIPGKIVAADKVFARMGHEYYFKVEFFDDGEKILYTEGYKGNPFFLLKDMECNVYKFNGKYVEADFHLREKPEDCRKPPIPVNNRDPVSLREIGKVTEK